MKRWMAAIFLAAAGCGGGPSGSADSAGRDPADRGHELYSEGKFEAAQRELEAVVARNPKSTLARRILGRIYLLRGRHKEASLQFLSYVTLTRSEQIPVDATTVQDLFWAFYRMDDYNQAAKAAAMLDDSVLSTKYAEMARRGPAYTPEWRDTSCVLPYLVSNPVIRSHGVAGNFTFDLGAGEIVLGREFAKGVRVQVAGVPSPGFERVEQGIVESLDLPGLRVRNVPVVVTPDQMGVDGVFGVGFLSHFQVTIDHRRGRVVLRPAGSEAREGEALPLYFAGDRTLLAPARVDGIETYLIINPTARGVRFVPSQAMLIEKARRAPKSPALERVELGSMTLKVETQDPEKFPPGLDGAYGFTVGGMLGADAFKSKTLTFDFKAMKIHVE